MGSSESKPTSSSSKTEVNTSLIQFHWESYGYGAASIVLGILALGLLILIFYFIKNWCCKMAVRPRVEFGYTSWFPMGPLTNNLGQIERFQTLLPNKISWQYLLRFRDYTMSASPAYNIFLKKTMDVRAWISNRFFTLWTSNCFNKVFLPKIATKNKLRQDLQSGEQLENMNLADRLWIWLKKSIFLNYFVLEKL